MPMSMERGAQRLGWLQVWGPKPRPLSWNRSTLLTYQRSVSTANVTTRSGPGLLEFVSIQASV